MYTLSSGIEYGWPKSLDVSRAEFIKNRFDIIKEPYVEAIPNYFKDKEWTWKNLSDGKIGKDKEELDSLSDLLSNYSKWTPYPHQIQSIRDWQEGKHVVVATGTGSGKTECFLYPMLGQMIREAKRAKKTKKPMQRGVKAIILYPMNALVADQTVRIRDMFGTLKMSKKLEKMGAGRPCQFGMYTGRTPSHGWYSEPGKKGWKLKTNGPKDKVSSIIKAYGEIERKHPDLWKRLVDDRRVPAKGGKWIYDPHGDWTIEDVPANVSIPDGISKNDARFSPVDSWSMLNFQNGIKKNSINGFKKDISHIGQQGDRELYARYEMHEGALFNMEQTILRPQKNLGSNMHLPRNI